MLYSDSDARQEAQQPFRCGSATDYGYMTGISIDIMKFTSARHMFCAWAGPHCSHDDLVDLIYAKGQRGYKLAIGNMMADTPRRTCLVNTGGLIPADEIAIALVRSEAPNPGLEAVSNFFREAFGFQSSIIIGTALVIALIFVCLVAMCLSGATNSDILSNLMSLMAGATDSSVMHDGRATNTIAPRKRLAFAVVMVLALTLGGHGILLAGALDSFVPTLEGREIELSELKKKGEGVVAVPQDGFFEAIVRRHCMFFLERRISKWRKQTKLLTRLLFCFLDVRLYFTGSMTETSSKTWTSCTLMTDCVTLLAAGDSMVKYAIGFRTNLQEIVTHRGLCDKIMVRGLGDGSRWRLGWMYNSLVSKQQKVMLDAEVAALGERGEVDRMIEYEVNDAGCEAETAVTPLVVVLVLLFVFVLFWIIVGTGHQMNEMGWWKKLKRACYRLLP